MDRTYVAQQQKTPVFQLGLELWRDHVIRNKQISERLLATLSDLVCKERLGETIDKGLLRSISQVGVRLCAAITACSSSSSQR